MLHSVRYKLSLYPKCSNPLTFIPKIKKKAFGCKRIQMTEKQINKQELQDSIERLFE